jgi:hypothetical protein
MNRKPGRPAILKDKNRRPIPARADRDRPMKWFFEEVPRQDFTDALQLSGDERFRRLHDALNDNAYGMTSFPTLCRRFGLSWSDCMNLWWEYNRLWGLLAILNRLPKILEDLAEDSRSHSGPCPVCDGIGNLTADGVGFRCVACEGGKVRIPGDAHARRLLFEILGLIGPKRGHPAVTASEQPTRYPAYPISVEKE